MSKAFTREDDAPDPGARKPLPSPLPPGAKNYVTPEGAQRLRAELDRLIDEERPAATAATSDPRTSERVQALDERIRNLQRSLESAVVVPRPSEDVDTVRFGATVSVRAKPGGPVTRYRIVGVDETDVERGWISWVSPIAKALLAAGVGDRVRLQLPSGERELEIVGIEYEA